MPVQQIELEEVQMVETTDEALEVAGVGGGGFGQSVTCVEFMGAELAC